MTFLRCCQRRIREKRLQQQLLAFQAQIRTIFTVEIINFLACQRRISTWTNSCPDGGGQTLTPFAWLQLAISVFVELLEQVFDTLVRSLQYQSPIGKLQMRTQRLFQR